MVRLKTMYLVTYCDVGFLIVIVGIVTDCLCLFRFPSSFGYNSHGGVRGERRCGYPFDGAGKVLAHAFFPEDGRAHFDEAETYTDGTSRGTNLLWVATHEFGHALGLDHSEVRAAIMYPYYTGYVPNMRLHSDDIAGIQYLYGMLHKFKKYHSTETVL